MIQFDNVTLFSTTKEPIVQKVSFQIEKGEKCVLTGPSGCGKSTVLRAVPAGIELWEGAVSIDNEVLSHKNVHSLRSKIGYIPQEPRLPEGTVKQYLTSFCSAARLHWNDSLESKAVSLLEIVKLSGETLEQDTRRLSRGERQRVAIIAILMLERPIILADEITSALDHESKTAVMDLLFSSDATILSVSHELSWVDRCDRSIDVTAFRGVKNV